MKRYEGLGTLLGNGKVQVNKEGSEPQEISADKILIATGSYAANLPNIDWDSDRIGCSTTALSFPEVPKHLVVIGAGVIGLELGSVWARLGANVTVLEYMDHAMPGMDSELGAEAVKVFKQQGIK